MSFRNVFLAAVAVVCLGLPALPQVNGIDVAAGATASVFGGKSPHVQVTDPDGNVLATIAIGMNPARFIYSESANTLYVVHNEKNCEHHISAVNLTTQRVDKDIKVNAGCMSDLFSSDGGRRVFWYAAGKGGNVAGILFQGDIRPPFEPAISVIDTASNEVIATYNWLEDIRAGVPSESRNNFILIVHVLAASDRGDVIVTSEVVGKQKYDNYQFVVLSGRSSRPVLIPYGGGSVVASMFSQDQKLLFVAVEGSRKTTGSLVVVNLEKGTAVSHALEKNPTTLLRLGSSKEPWVLSSQELRAFSEAGEPGDRRIQLTKPRKPEEGEESSASAFMDGLPGETISLGNDHAAIQINKKNGGSIHKVALVDLKQLQIDAIVRTMSSGQIAAARTGRFLAAFGMSMATGGIFIFVPNFAQNAALAAPADGRFLYVLDLEFHEITVVDVQSATAVKRIPVNNTITRVKVSADGKHLICFGKKTQQIDLESNSLEN